MEQDQAAAGNLLDECPEVSRIALASAGSRRDIWLAAFALDGRIGRMVLGASEPMLGQMRLAWWRDQLGAAASARPQGDLLLDLIGRTWAGNELPLLALVDGWEETHTEAGDVYYYNTTTGEARWEPPTL